jgi:hypothetical protein
MLVVAFQTLTAMVYQRPVLTLLMVINKCINTSVCMSTLKLILILILTSNSNPKVHTHPSWVLRGPTPTLIASIHILDQMASMVAVAQLLDRKPNMKLVSIQAQTATQTLYQDR